MISIVIPIFNEEKTLSILKERLLEALVSVEQQYEVIMVDDGSRDYSFPLMVSFHQQDARFKAIRLSRNFGHQAALSAGLDYASGDAVILMDGDLQDPPEVLPQFIKQWKNGWQVVYGVKSKRKEQPFKRFAFWFFYRVLDKVANISMPLDAGIFSLVDRAVVDVLKSMPERNKYLSGMRSWVGFKQAGLVYERGARYNDRPRQSFTRLVRMALDAIFSFSSLPLKFFVYLGFFISSLSFLGALTIVTIKVYSTLAIPGWASIMVSLYFLGGVQLLSIGILGEYVSRIFDEVKSRPYYVIEESVGIVKIEVVKKEKD